MNPPTVGELPSPDTPQQTVRSLGADFEREVAQEIALAGGESADLEVYEGAVGRTMFDTPSSRDNTVTVLLTAEQIGALPSQALVRIMSRSAHSGGDGRQYLGAVVEGPFAEPDGLRADAPIVVATTVRGAQFLPRYHGRVQVAILGEEVDGILEPPRLRPLPNSPVYALADDEMRSQLGIVHPDGIELGFAVGFESMRVQVPAHSKAVLPRHIGILGTTGGGKSTTVSGLVASFAEAGIATVVLDTEGEYTEIGNPTSDPTMVRLLQRTGRNPRGVPNVIVRHLHGRRSTAPTNVTRVPFRLDFSSLSPYATAEILDLSEAQVDRFLKAYDVAKLVLRDLGIFPARDSNEEERRAFELNEFEEGYPRLTLSMLIDIARLIQAHTFKGSHEPYNEIFRSTEAQNSLRARIATIQTSSEVSWRTLISKLFRLQRTGIFDNPAAQPIPFPQLTQAGQTTIVDLSDTDSTIINNLVIASLLHGILEHVERSYAEAERAGRAPTPLMIVIEEAHEFLSSERIAKMQILFEQVARLARRGRKRWIGLVLVTQLPQHLPDEVLGLVNNFILHKIGDANVVARLKRNIGGVDDSLWSRLPNLAPGQAVISMTSMTRPLLVAVHPTPAKLRMVD